MKKVRKTLFILASVIVAAIAGVAWFLSPAVPQGTLNKLTTGMPQAEAENLLGKPRETINFTWGSEPVTVWRYTSPFHSGLVDVFFSQDGYFKDYNYERF